MRARERNLVILAGLVIGLSAAIPAAQAADEPLGGSASPAPLSRAERIVGPLREIGHVTARSAFCTALQQDGAPAATSAIAFEVGLLGTVSDMENVRIDNMISKAKSIGKLESDIAQLYYLAKSGSGQLADLRTLVSQSDPDLAKAIKGFHDALDGAKARQRILTKHIARIVGMLAEREPYSITNLPVEDPQAQGAYSLSNDYLDTQEDLIRNLAVHGLFQSGPEDEKIQEDLETAADRAAQVITLGKC